MHQSTFSFSLLIFYDSTSVFTGNLFRRKLDSSSVLVVFDCISCDILQDLLEMERTSDQVIFRCQVKAFELDY